MPFLQAYRHRLQETATNKLVRVAVRELEQLFAPAAVVLAQYDRALDEWRADGELRTREPVTEEEVHAALLRRALPGQRHSLALQLELDDRHAQIVVLRDRAEAFAAPDVEQARAILDLAEHELQSRAEDRRRAIVERVYAQLLHRPRGNDLHYQVLHAIRDLINYDHSAAVFVRDPATEGFRLQAEQIAWKKGRSSQIGLRVENLQELASLLGSANQPLLYRRDAAGGWNPDDPANLTSLPLAFLSYHERMQRPLPRSALVATLSVEDRCVGVLAAFGLEARSLGLTSGRHVRAVLPLAAVAIRNQGHDEGVEEAFLEEQKKNAVADVARGVAHDINNALTALLLRSQVLHRDLEEDPAAAGRYLEDVKVIEQYARSCQRIFEGMLQFAKRGTSGLGEIKLQDCVRNVLQLHAESLQSAGIELTVRIDPDVPPVRGNAQQLERVIHNLILNARQASRRGDQVYLALRRRGGWARLQVANSGVGIPKKIMARVMEPFFTTRARGHGLGLSVCRSIVVEHGGRIRLRSRQGTGTLVSVALPLAGDEG